MTRMLISMFCILALVGAIFFAPHVPMRLRRFGERIRPSAAFAAVLFLFIISPRLALAAVTGATTSTDLTNVWLVVVAIATPVLTYAATAAGHAIAVRLKIQAGSAAADDLDQALEHGVNLALTALGSFAAHNSAVTLPAGPVANAVQLVLKLAPAAVSSLGINEAEVTQMLIGRIGKLLGQPTTVSPAAS